MTPRTTLALAALLAPLLLSACSVATRSHAGSVPTLAQRIDSILDGPPLQHTSWGVVVREQESGRVLYQRNPQLHFIPASNTKLVVTTVAMGTLGPDWRYHTPILARTLPGDSVAAELRIVGSGDPTFSARFWQRPYGAADAIAATIAAAGIRHIRALTIDATRFSDAVVNGSWEVGDLPGTSAPPTAAFAFEEGTFRLEVRGGSLRGEPAWVSPLVPGGTAQPVRATVLTDTAGAPARTSSDYTARRDTIYLAGRIGAGAVDTVRMAMTDAAAFAARTLAAVLGQRGVPVDSVVVLRSGVAIDTAGLRSIGVLESPPLADIVAGILQPSQNWIAEQLLKTLGSEAGTAGSWSGGLAVERRYLTASAGLDSLAFSLRDASGLSAQNLLTPTAVVQLLEHARGSSWGGQYRSALAGPGVTGSTLDTRLRALQGRLRGKTGTISNVNSLSGYLTADGGRNLTFSILSNGSGVASGLVRAAIDSTVALLAREVR